MHSLPYDLDLGDGGPAIPCRDAYHALLLARVWHAITYGYPLPSPQPSTGAILAGLLPVPDARSLPEHRIAPENTNTMPPAPVTWRFVAAADVPEAGIRRGDILVAAPGRPTRLLRQMPIDPGLLLNLALQQVLIDLDGVVGATAPIVEAMGADAAAPSPAPIALRVVR